MTANLQFVRSIGEIPGADSISVQVFYVAKSNTAQFLLEFSGSKKV